jgi:hypothetical protein
MRLFTCVLSLSLAPAAFGTAVVSAQEAASGQAVVAPPAAEQPTAEQTAPARPAEDTTDVSDLWRRVRHKNEQVPVDLTAEPSKDRFLVFAPTFGSKPSTGLTVGLNGNMAFFRGDTSTRLSTVGGGVRVSQKKQVLANLRYALFGSDEGWYFDGDNRANWTSINAYGLGAFTDTSDATNVKYDFLRFYEAAYRRVKPGLFVGGGFNLNSRYNIHAGGSEASFDNSAYVSYTESHGFPLDHQASAGGNVAVRYDTRDNAINAERGWLAAATYRTYFKGFVGGDATYQQVSIDVRTYRSLTRTGSQRIAFWMVSDLVTGGVAPFLDLPTTGSDARSGRGYTEGRNRGEHLAYGEIEYRGALTPSGLAGFVAFVNTTTIGSSDTGAHLFENAAPAAGFGLRLLLNKRSRTNFYTDWGWGTNGSRGFYLGIQEAF